MLWCDEYVNRLRNAASFVGSPYSSTHNLPPVNLSKRSMSGTPTCTSAAANKSGRWLTTAPNSRPPFDAPCRAKPPAVVMPPIQPSRRPRLWPRCSAQSVPAQLHRPCHAHKVSAGSEHPNCDSKRCARFFLTGTVAACEGHKSTELAANRHGVRDLVLARHSELGSERDLARSMDRQHSSMRSHCTRDASRGRARRTSHDAAP